MCGDFFYNCAMHEIESRIMVHSDWTVFQVSAGCGCTVCYRDTKQLRGILVAARLQLFYYCEKYDLERETTQGHLLLPIRDRTTML